MRPTGPVARLASGRCRSAIGVADGELLTWSLTPIERQRDRTPHRTPPAERARPRPVPPPRRRSSATGAAAPACSGTATLRQTRRRRLRPASSRAPVQLPGAGRHRGASGRWCDVERFPRAATRRDAQRAAGDPPSTMRSRRPSRSSILARPAASPCGSHRGTPSRSTCPSWWAGDPRLQRVDSGVAPRLVTVPSPTRRCRRPTCASSSRGTPSSSPTCARRTARVVTPAGGGPRRLRPGRVGRSCSPGAQGGDRRR